jgi:DNA-binding transcriptional regulator WhiA
MQTARISSVTREGRAYISGFFDGEGCVHSPLNRGSPVVRMSITQKHPEVLVEIHNALGYGRLVHHRAGHWVLYIGCSDEVQHFIRLIYPWSKVKRRELKLAYQLCELVGTSKKGGRMRLHRRLKDLKHGTT